MTYTAAQLIAGYTAANDGVAPSAALLATVNSQAAASATGQLSDAAALGAMIKSALSTTDVAVQAYQFFTGKTPSKAGLDFLVNSPTNPNDLNDPYYAAFNDENRYINFAANLGLIGEGKDTFKAAYGSLSFGAFIASVYETIIGSAYINAVVGNPGASAAAIADVTGRQAAFTQTARDRGLINANSSAADIDIATKAAAIGYLLYEGAKADIGIYAAGVDNFVAALIAGTAQYNINLLTTYSVLGGGIGSPLPPAAITTNLTVPADNFLGTNSNDVVNGLVYSDSGVPPFVTTFSALDTLNGQGGTDTLNLTVSKSTGGATGNVVVPTASVSNFEIINITALSNNAADVVTVSGAGFNGATTFNTNQSTNAVTFTNLPTGAVVGLIPPTGGVAVGALTFGYATPTAAATLNLATGFSFAPITITSTPAAVTINSVGAVVNNPGVINLGGSVTALTLNVTTPIVFGSSLTGFSTGATITVAGAVANNAAATFGPGVAPGVVFNTLPANIATVTASGLTATGIAAVIGANPAISITGGAGSDFISVTSGTGAALSGTINGGAGTDVVSFSNTADLTIGSGAKFTNCEILNVVNSGGAATLQAFDTSLITGLTGEWVQGSSGSVQFNNLAAAPNVTVFGNLSGTNSVGALSLRLANAGGATDSVTLTLNNGNTAAAAGINGVTVSSLQLGGSTTLGQVETLNIVSGGTITGTTPPAYNSVTLAASGAGPNFVDPNTVNITGSQGTVLVTGVLGHNITVNASAATGGLQFLSAAGTTGANFTTNVNGSAANDSIVYGANQGGTILGGSGGDLIALDSATVGITVAYKAASDSLLDLTGTAGASGSATLNTGKMDTISGFFSGVGGDKIQLVDLGAAFNAPQIIADKGGAANAAAVTALLATSTFYQDSTNTVRHVAQFDYNGGTLLVADADNNGVYSAGDLVVFLAGVNQLVASDLVGS